MSALTKNQDTNDLRGQERGDALGLALSLREQVGQKALRQNLIRWGIAALLFGLVFLLVYRSDTSQALYTATLAAVLAFLVIQLTEWPQRADVYLAGQSLSAVEAVWLQVIRVGLTVGASFSAIYYLVDRMELAAVPAGLLIAVCLFLGHIAVSFISYPVLLYIIFGLLTTVVSMASFNGMNLLLYGTVTGGGSSFGWFVPKLVSWVLAVLFAYLTNRNLVFRASGNFWHEMLKFFLARILSGLLVEFLGLFVLENLLAMDRDISNLLISLIVVVVNYVFSKLFVFRQQQ